MAAVAPIEDLREVKKDIEAFAAKNPEAYADLVTLIGKHRRVGYRNICRMALGDTPEDLKA